MSTLSGQSINSTYQGLLKLQNSSSGITSSFQNVEDGLGNATGLRIATNQLEGPGLVRFIPLKAQYYGSGMSGAVPAQYSAGVQNTILCVPFYDQGLYAYSAITTFTAQISTSTDTLEYAIYTSQMINPYGLYPHTPIVSGCTADTFNTGAKTFTPASTFSMSGYGAGIYWLVYKISNSPSAQPTFRPGAMPLTPAPIGVQSLPTAAYGVVSGITSNSFTSLCFRANNSLNTFMHLSGLSTFDNPYANTINTLQSTSTAVAGVPMGFLLHTVDF